MRTYLLKQCSDLDHTILKIFLSQDPLGLSNISVMCQVCQHISSLKHFNMRALMQKSVTGDPVVNVSFIIALAPNEGCCLLSYLI
jgi:hypothetical protein